MPSLSDLPNIGKTLETKLKESGIANIAELKALGSEKALIKISIIEDSGACLNMLYALEGAVQGVRWYNLEKERKQELKEFYKVFHGK